MSLELNYSIKEHETNVCLLRPYSFTCNHLRNKELQNSMIDLTTPYPN